MAWRYAMVFFTMLKHNVYFEGKVQSVGFERHGRRHTVGVLDVGEFHFGTDAAERMTVVSGELWAKLPGRADFQLYPAGTSFEVPSKNAFDVRALEPAAYLCEFL
jgi:purine/pyrimidine-nucleoside phosphorylase